MGPVGLVVRADSRQGIHRSSLEFYKHKDLVPHADGNAAA
jgi:hypothetical protein